MFFLLTFVIVQRKIKVLGEIMKILFCTDGSDISLMALENISHFMKDAIFDIICVIDWSFLPESMNMERENYSKTYENIAESVLSYAEKEVLEKNFQIGEKIKSFGSPVEGILEQLEKVDYDLVLMGSHGKKGIQKWLGSVSRQIISNTKSPIFISKQKNKNKKILLTVDGTEHSDFSVKHALEILDMRDKEIFIISVKENPELLPIEATLDKNWLDNIDKQQKIHASKAINKAKSYFEKAGIIIKNEAILTGSPAQKIIEFAGHEEIDLIIMGARTKANLSTLLLGSVSKRVLENVHASVLIVRK